MIRLPEGEVRYRLRSELNVWVMLTVTEISSDAVPQLAGTEITELIPAVLLSVIATEVELL